MFQCPPVSPPGSRLLGLQEPAPASLITFLLPFPSHTPLEHARHTPAFGPPHQLFPLLEILSLIIWWLDALPPVRVCLPCPPVQNCYLPQFPIPFYPSPLFYFCFFSIALIIYILHLLWSVTYCLLCKQVYCWDVSPMRAGIFVLSLMHPKCLGQCLTSGRYSVNISE